MKPPYDLNNNILNSLTSILEKIGEVNAAHLHKPSPELTDDSVQKWLNPKATRNK